VRHGEELEVLHEGIRIFPKSVEPLGIEDGTHCWGLWVQGQRENLKEAQTRHLVISPIHPDYWTSVFHLKLKLADDLGALDKATGLLSDLGINLLFSDCAPSGYRQATFTAICENEGIRSLTKQILKAQQLPPSPLFNTTESVTGDNFHERQFQEIGTILLINLAILYAEIRIRESQMFETGGPFLHPRAIETGPQPWYVPASAIESIAEMIAAGKNIPVWPSAVPAMNASEVLEVFEQFKAVAKTRVHSLPGDKKLLTQEALEALATGSDIGNFIKAGLIALWRSHRVEPVSLRGLLTLAYQRVWSADARINLIYDRRAALLKFHDTQSRDDFFDSLNITSTSAQHFPPSPSIASLHRHDRFIRLRFLDQSIGRRLVSIGLNFHSPRNPVASATPSHSDSVTKGLLHTVAHTLAGEKINLLRLRSQALEFDTEYENGTFQLVGLLPEGSEPLKQSTRLEEIVRKDIKGFNDRIELRELKINPLLRHKLFLSIPQDTIRRDEIVETVEEVSRHYGFQVVLANTELDNVTDEVVNKIKSSTAMLQIIVLPESAKPRSLSRSVPDFQWLWAEYGMALIASLPTQRILDSNIPDSALDHVRPRLNQDRPIKKFSTNSDFRKTLRPIIEDFLRTITGVTSP
jgi:hypothetical protein